MTHPSAKTGSCPSLNSHAAVPGRMLSRADRWTCGKRAANTLHSGSRRPQRQYIMHPQCGGFRVVVRASPVTMPGDCRTRCCGLAWRRQPQVEAIAERTGARNGLMANPSPQPRSREQPDAATVKPLPRVANARRGPMVSVFRPVLRKCLFRMRAIAAPSRYAVA